MADKLKVKIISPERMVYEGEADELITQGVNGQFGILPNHIPFMTPIDIGVTKIINEGETEYFATLGGTFQVKDNEIIILAKCAERAGEIDVMRAEAAKERAEARLGNKEVELDAVRANIAIAKALARLKAATKQH